MDLRKIMTAKNAGFRTKTIEVPEWGVSVTVREPLHFDFARYIKSIKDISENDELSDSEKDLMSIKAEVLLYASIMLDEQGDLLFDKKINEKGETVFDYNLEDLINSYGPVHTRLANEAISLVGLKSKPIEEAEKK